MITPNLLTKLRDGRCTPDELAQLRAYFAQTDQTDLDTLLTSDWQVAGREDQANPLHEAQARVWQRLAESVKKNSEPMQPLNRPPARLLWQRWAVAASVVGLLLAGGWWSWQQSDAARHLADTQRVTRAETADWVSLRNTTSKPVTTTLADGSTVTLEPQSQLRYPAQFEGALRTVQLSGQAFFAVRPDKAHPFVVQTKAVLVRVLGTSFTVRAVAGQPTAAVSVRTGRVSVLPANGNVARAGIVLKPNEKATLTVATGQVARSLVAQPALVNEGAVTNRFVFTDTPVSKVFDELERAYGIAIQYDPKTFSNCTLTARLTDQPLFTKLEMICASIGANYRVDDTYIRVQGAGCE